MRSIVRLPEFVQALREIAERDQGRARDAADLELVRLADVDERELVAAVQTRFDLGDLDVAFLDRGRFGLHIWQVEVIERGE